MIDRFIDGVGDRLIGLVPDWLVWLFSIPLQAWVLIGIAFGLGIIYGKGGLKALFGVSLVMAILFWLGRHSGDAQEGGADHRREPELPRNDGRIFQRFFKRRRGKK